MASTSHLSGFCGVSLILLKEESFIPQPFVTFVHLVYGIVAVNHVILVLMFSSATDLCWCRISAALKKVSTSVWRSIAREQLRLASASLSLEESPGETVSSHPLSQLPL